MKRFFVGSKTIFLIAFAITTMMLCGCSREGDVIRLERKEISDFDMTKAFEMQQNGQFAEALDLFRNVVIAQPSNAMAHLQCGILFQDVLSDHFSAFYHLSTYLYIRPISEKNDMVQERIKRAKQHIVKTINTEINENNSAPEKELLLQIETLDNTIAERNKKIFALAEENNSLSNSVEKLTKNNVRLQRLLDTMIGDSDKALPNHADSGLNLDKAINTITNSVVNTANPSFRTYKVARGDSVWSIGKSFFGDTSRNADIYDLNPGKIGDDGKLVEGTILIIPW